MYTYVVLTKPPHNESFTTCFYPPRSMHTFSAISRLIMLQNLPIMLSGNSFFFPCLLFPKLCSQLLLFSKLCSYIYTIILQIMLIYLHNYSPNYAHIFTHNDTEILINLSF